MQQPNQLTPEQLARRVAQWRKDRQRARTDLLWLCNEVLQYKDVEAAVHGPIIELLQKFKGGIDDDKGYRPAVDVWELEGPRKRLFLDPRGHLKTTVITISHTIQWIINYPDIRVLLSMATGDQVTKVMSEVLNHFRFNENFRWLFPDFCPAAKSAKDFGNMESFTVPNRKRKWLKEPTVSSCSVGRVVAGGHYEVLKNSDLVDKENVKTPNQIREVTEHFKYLNPLLERGGQPPQPGWMDVEGTRYDFSDLYGWIKDTDEKRKEREWQISERAAIMDGKILWPTRFSLKDLKSIEEDDEYIFACQYLQNPVPIGSGLCTRDEIQWKPRKVMRAIPMHYHMTIDLAGMDPSSNGDYTVLNVHGFDTDGRMNVVEILADRLDPFNVIELIFAQCKAFPQIQDIKIEREAHSRVLLPFLKREQEKKRQTESGFKYLPPIIEIKRDNRTAKKQRIKGLQPWFKGRLISFAEEVTSKLETIQQICRFSDVSTYHDDILDTLADAMQNRDGGVTSDVYPDVNEPYDGKTHYAPRPFRGVEKFTGFDPVTHEMTWAGDKVYAEAWCDPRTGI